MFSYARGPEAPLIEATVGRVLEETAAAHPSALALVSRHQGLRLTFGELHKQAAQVAAGLAELGLRPGDRAGVWASNSAEWVLLQLGAAIAGAVLVNVNPAYRSHELRFVLQKSRMKALFFHERDARADYLEILAEARSGLELPLEHAIPLAGGAWRRMLATGGAPARPALSPGDVVNIQYTSGTTGSPKGVLLTHRNLLNNAWLVGQSLKVAPGDRLCAPVPLYHCFGCVMGSLMCLVHGIPIVLPSAQFDAGAALAAVEAERCTLLYGVPTMFIAELEYPGFARYDLSCLRSGIMAGAPCPIDVMRRVVEQMHCREMTIAYGQTEASPVITQSATDDSLELRVSTVGRCLPNTEVKIVEPRSGRTVPAGEPGELCARGYLVMKGYDGEPEATAAAIDPEGWLHTGDLATMREDGCFHIRGRSKEMI
ncbi:MAG: AMP-binding protein, partial [Acidobacteria bacterium]|nr:AMP-binding protein [Acidobacteriota bacterium]